MTNAEIEAMLYENLGSEPHQTDYDSDEIGQTTYEQDTEVWHENYAERRLNLLAEANQVTAYFELRLGVPTGGFPAHLDECPMESVCGEKCRSIIDRARFFMDDCEPLEASRAHVRAAALSACEVVYFG